MPSFKDKYGIDYKCDFDFKGANTLIMSGGALKCIYFLGSLFEIYSVTQFKYFGGTSSGAILATLLCIGYTPVEIFKKIVTTPKCGQITKTLDYTVQNIEKMFIDKNISPNITFEELFLLTGKELAFISSNVSKLREEIFSKYSHPNTKVITAMKLSCSLPIIFPVCKLNNDIFIDGIFFDNFPIKLSKIFKNSTKVVCITTTSSHYDRRITEFYKHTNIYKIIMIPDCDNNYFCEKKEDKFLMFVTGYNYILENINKSTKRRKRLHSV